MRNRCGNPRARSEPRAGGTVLRDESRRPRSRGHQDRSCPARGDDSRGFAPRIPNSNDSGYYYSVNRGKLSATVDLRKSVGVTVALDLVRHCDVVLENFAPGTMDRFGLGYAQLAAANPRIILCSISGFGQSGPMASAPAYDIVAQALGGTMSITGPATAIRRDAACRSAT